jgi:hypothetical protein
MKVIFLGNLAVSLKFIAFTSLGSGIPMLPSILYTFGAGTFLL